jgi:hypothetical protein
MSTLVRIVAVAVCILAIAPPAASAADLCISAGGALALAGRKFSLPGKNKCKPLTGFDNDTLCSGVACTAADGTRVDVYFTCADRTINLFRSFFYAFPLPLPSSNVGNVTYAELVNGTPAAGSAPPGSFELGPCVKPYLPVP